MNNIRAFERDAFLFLTAALSATLFHRLYYPLTDAGEPVVAAINLARHGAFALDGPLLPSAHLPPVYPFLLAIFFKLLPGDGGYVAMYVVNVVIHGLHAVLLLRMSSLLFGNARPGIFAAALTILLPALRMFPTAEAMLTAVCLMVFCLATARAAGPGSRSAAVGTGLGIGSLLLLHVGSLFITIPWTLLIVLRKRHPWRRTVGWSATCAVMALVVLAPWTIRNYRQLGGFVPVRDNLGLELLVSNNPCAQVTMIENMASGCYQQTHPGLNSTENARRRQMGELAYNREKMERAIRWMRENPGRFWRLTLERVFEFWLPASNWSGIYDWMLCLITVLSIPGLYLAVENHRRGGVFLLTVLAGFPVIYYFVQANIRYRYPIAWAALLPAGLALHWVEAWIAGQPTTLRSGRPWQVAVRNADGGGSEPVYRDY